MGILNIDQLPKKEEVLVIPKFQNVDKTIGELSDRLNSIGDISDEDIRNVIFSSYDLFLDDIYLRNEIQREEIINVFSNKRFIRILTDCVNNRMKMNLNSIQIICCNKIAWDASCSDKLDMETKDLLLNLAYQLNRTEINFLCTYIELKLAMMISLAAHSSFDNKKNVQRVNSILISIECTDIQTIVNIYSVLFSNSLTNLFESTMFDKNKYEYKPLVAIYGAILAIMENMDSETIRAVLYSYAETYRLMGEPSVPFSMRTKEFVELWPRISRVISSLENDSIYVY